MPVDGYFPDWSPLPNRGSPMSTALRTASNALVAAARLYKELALSASDLFRPDTYRAR